MLACSGPGAAQHIAQATTAGYILLAVAWILLALVGFLSLFGGERGKVVVVQAVLTLAHPGLWLSATGGDCGRMRVVASFGLTCLCLVLALWTILRYLRGLKAAR